ncbi:MAG TPA: TolC family protein [Cyclobacteriaceae bacterium]
MKPFYKLLLAILVATPAMAWAQESQQQSQSSTFTLEQCIQYALENSTNLKNSVIDESIADSKVRETRGIGLPQISGNVTLMDNTKLQRMFFQTGPETFVGDIPGIKSGSVISQPNIFQQRSSGTATVTVNQILFNGSYLVGLKASKSYRDLATKSTNLTKEQIIQNVSKAYYGVVINKERTKLFTTNIGRVDSLLRSTKALHMNGFAEGIDVDRIQVTLNNLITERDKFLNLDELSRELLKFQMNYPMDNSIDVVGTISEVELVQNLETYKEGWDYKNRPDYSILEANKALQELNIKNVRAGSLPSLSAFGNFGYSTQSNNVMGLFKTNSSLQNASPEVQSRFSADKWFNYSNYGLVLSVPIFTGFQQKNKIQQQKLSLVKIENNEKLLRSSIDLETKQALIVYGNALKTLQSQKENMDLATNIARITKIKYEQGVGSNIEVIDAESSLKEAQTNYYGALYDAALAKVDLDKAYGKLTPQTQTK